MKKFEITGMVNARTSVYNDEIEKSIFSKLSDYEDLKDYLSKLFTDNNIEPEPMVLWENVLIKFDELLIEAGSFFLLKNLGQSKNNVDLTIILRNKYLCVSILEFLSRLIERADEKHYFQSLQIIHDLMTSWDFEISKRASQTMFHLCFPSTSVFSYTTSEFELKDNFELPQGLVSPTLSLFEGLGMLNKDFSIFDYVKSRSIAGYGPLQDEIYFSVKQPPEKDSSGAKTNVKILLNPTYENILLGNKIEDLIELKLFFEDLKDIHNINDLDELITVMSVIRTASSYRGNVSNRIALIKLRLNCFYILLHTRISIDLMLPYLSTGTVFLKDLISLCDINSELSSELKQLTDDYISISAIAMESVVCLIAIITRKRGSLLQLTGIMSDLGLRLQPSRSSRYTELNSQLTDVNWTTLISSTCQLSMNMVQNYADNENKSLNNRSMQRLIDSGIEFFLLCLTSVDNTAQLGSLLTSVVGIIRCSLPSLQNLLNKFDNILNERSNNVLNQSENNILLLVERAFACLDSYINHGSSRSNPHYNEIMQESCCLSTVSDIIDMFGEFVENKTTEMISIWLKSFRLVIKNIFSFLSNFYKANRRRMISPADSAIQIIKQNSFNILGVKIFDNLSDKNEIIWHNLLYLYKEAIDLDPSYQAEVINGLPLQIFLKSIKIIDEKYNEKIKVHEFMVSLTRLIKSICITSEGQGFISHKGIIKYIIAGIGYKSSLLPISTGYDFDTLASIGKALALLSRESDRIRDSIEGQIESSVVSLCSEVQILWDRIYNDYDVLTSSEFSLSTVRMQSLKKLGNYVTLYEQLYLEVKRSSGSASRCICSENVVTFLVRAYGYSLPLSKQLFAQLGVRNSQAMATTHFGFVPTAKAITSFLKLQATNSPQILLTVLTKAIDSTLNQVSTHKQALRSRLDSIGLAESLTENLHDVEYLNIKKSRKQRSRGSSLTDESCDLLILGLLNAIPNKCSFDSQLFSNDEQLEVQIWKFLSSVIYLEWLTLMLSYTLRPNPTTYSRTIDKEVLRRLFGFHRSSLMEVCRYVISKWKPSSSLKSASNLAVNGESLAELDSTEDEIPIPRIPYAYLVRVISCSGALLREDCEIDGSRVTFLADFGNICKAYERSQTTSGVVRYRTGHGWMSEYRKDSQSEIVEILNVLPWEESDDQSISVASSEETEKQKSFRKLREMMTLRESACFALMRINISLRIVAMHLSHSIVQYSYRGTSHRNRRGETDAVISASAPMISKSLTKIIKGLFSYSNDCLQDTPNSTIFDSNAVDCIPISTSTPIKELYKKLNKKGINKLKDIRQKEPKTKETLLLYQNNSNDSIYVNKATVCLYFEMVFKYVVLPVLDDRNGQLNTHLLRNFMSYHVVEDIVDALLFLITTFIESRNELEISNDNTKIGVNGQAALHALPHALTVLKKLVQPKVLIDSQITHYMKSSVDSFFGPFYVYEQISYIYQVLGKKLLPVLNEKLLVIFPTSIQIDWYNIIADLRIDLNEKLPLPDIHDIKSSTEKEKEIQDSSTSKSRRSIISGDAQPPQSTPLAPDESVLAMCQDMGFSRQQTINAINTTASNDMNIVMEYLFSSANNSNSRGLDPEDLEGSENDLELMAALQMSLASSESDTIPPVPDELASTSTPTTTNDRANDRANHENVIASDDQEQVGISQGYRSLISNLNVNESLVIGSSQNTDAERVLLLPNDSVELVSRNPNSNDSNQNNQSNQNEQFLNEEVNYLGSQRNNYLDSSYMSTIDEIRNPFRPLGRSSTSPSYLSDHFLRINRAVSRASSKAESPVQDSLTLKPQTIQINSFENSSVFKDFKIKEVELKNLYDAFNQDLLKENFIFSCIYASKVTFYNENTSTISFITQLFQAIINMNIPSLYQIFLTNLIDYTKLFILSESNNMQSNEDWSGILLMILCFLKNRNMKVITAVTEEISNDLFNTLHIALKVTLGPSNWPCWVSSCLVILHELLLSIKSEKVVLNDLNKNSLDSKVEKDIIEEKNDGTINTDEPIENATIENICNNICLKVRNGFTIPRNLWMDLFTVIVSVLKTTPLRISEGSKLSNDLSDIYSGLILLLSDLVNDPSIAFKFIYDDVIALLLTIPNAYSSKDNTTLLSKLLQNIFHITKYHNFEGDIIQIFTKFDKTANVTEKITKMSINEFMKKLILNSRIFSHTKEICSTVLNICKLSKKTSINSEKVKSIDDDSEFMIQLNENTMINSSQNVENSKDNDLQFKLIQFLLSHAVEPIISNSIYQIDDILNSISDSLLSHRGITSVTSKVISMDLSKLILNQTNIIKQKAKLNFVDFLIKTYFMNDSSELISTDRTEVLKIRASSRFLVTLCYKRGIPRKVVLNSIAKYMKQFAKPSPDNSIEESIRLSIVTRLSLFLQILFKTCTKPSYVSSTESNDNVMDAILQLIDNSITDILTESLAFIPLTNPKASDAVNAILEPLEILSRPQYQKSFGSTVVSDSLGNPQLITLNADNFGSMTSSPPIPTRVVLPGRSYEDEDEYDDVIDDRFELVEETNDENDDNEDNDDDDEDGENDDDEDDDDDENDEDEIDEDGNVINRDEDEHEEEDEDDENNMNEYDDGEEEENSDSESEANIFSSSRFQSSLTNPEINNMPSFSRLRGVLQGDMNPYVTPPDHIRQDPLQVIMTDLRTSATMESPEDMIRRLVQDASEGFGVFQTIRNNGIVSISAINPTQQDRQSGLISNTGNQFLTYSLPGGIDAALQVHRPIYLHPLLAGSDSTQQTARTGSSVNSSNDANIGTISQSLRVQGNRNELSDILHGPPGTLRRENATINSTNENLDTTSRDNQSTNVNHVLSTILFDNLITALTDFCLEEEIPNLIEINDVPTSNLENIVDDNIDGVATESAETNNLDDEDTVVENNDRNNDSYSASESEVTRVETIGDIITVGSSATESVDFSMNESLLGNRSLQDTLAGTSHSISILTSDAIRGPTDFDNVSMLSSIPTSESDEEENNDTNVDSTNVVNTDDIEVNVGTENDVSQNWDINDSHNSVLEISNETISVCNDISGSSQDNIVVTVDEDNVLQQNSIELVNEIEMDGEINTNGQGNPAITCPSGYDSDVFYSLPESMQLEIMEQHSQTNQQTRQLIEQAGYDYEMFESLPENIRQEILEQARRDHGSNVGASSSSSIIPSEPSPADNASFIHSLAPDLRAEILITADSAFLDSLPLELIEEAQRLRDQAARRLQEAELLRSEYQAPSNALQRSNNAMINSVLGRLGISDALDLNDNDEDDELHPHHPSSRFLRATSNQTQQQRYTSKDVNGYIRIPNDDVLQLSLPNRLLAILTKVFCSSSIKINAEVLQQLLYNLSKNPMARDITLRLLIGLLANDRDIFIESLQKLDISLYSAKAIYSLLIKSSEYRNINQTKSYQLRCYLNTDNSIHKEKTVSIISEDLQFIIGQEDISSDDINNSDQNVSIPSHIYQSIFFLLNHLLSQSQSVIFDTIRPRLSRGGDLLITNNTSTDNNIKNDTIPIRESNIDLSAIKDEYYENKSSNSLLEILLELLSYENLTRNSNDLASIISLIIKSSSPLELAIEENENKIVINPLTKEQQELKDIKYIPIPSISLAKESLQSLCDILLSDQCTKKIFNDINIIISRLTKLKSNRPILLQLLCNIIEDLIEQSKNKLINLNNIFNKILNSNSKSNQLSLLSYLPMSELGSKQHDHLLKTTQTLLLIASKINQSLITIMNYDVIYTLMDSLDEIFQYLKSYINIDENINNLQSNNIQLTSPNVSILLSILNRLLPCLQTIILFNTHDLCNIELDNKINNTSIESSNDSTKDNKVDSEINDSKDSASMNKASFAINISIPGLRYRQSNEYKRMNISLIDNDNNSNSLIRIKSLKSNVNINSKSYRLISFTQNHQLLLNLIIQSQPLLLEKSLNSLIRIIQLRQYISFENKRKFFLHQLQLHRRNSQLNMGLSSHSLHLHIRRDYVFEDSFDQLRGRSKEELLLGRLQINFSGEQGIDAGGLTREWFSVLSKEIFNPNYALFTAAADGATFQPNPFSMINSNHLSYFKFVGNVIGKAINDGQLMDAHFTRSFYKHLLGIPVDYIDIESTEPDYYNTLKQILENPLEVLMIDLTFSAETQIFGKTEVVDLIPNGRNILVTDENKFDYVRLISHHRMTTAIKAQIDSFLDGFYQLIPPELISIFSPTEIELLICGLPDVDVNDLKLNTEYHGLRNNDEMIIWFWEALNSFSQTERASFLQFVTGTSKVPLGGFSNLQGMRGTQKFSIHKAYGDHNQLPTAHTCFNQLDLPIYNSYEQLRDKLLLAIREGSEGFGFA